MISELNVGFGTTNPQKLLHLVENDVAIRLQDIRLENSSTNIEFINGDNEIFGASSNNIDWRISNSNSIFTIQSGSNNVINDIINFTNSGYIGIGTNDPKQKLHIIHSNNSLVRIEADQNLPSQVSGIEFGIPKYSSDTRSKITSTTYLNDASDIQFYTSSGASLSAPKMTIDINGNVGIGTTTNLINKLNVDGTISATLFSGKGDNLVDIPISGITNLQSTLDLNDKNSSNYVLSTSNILIAKADLNDSNSSNYVLSTSNILIAKADLNDSNSSNYILLTSNILIAKADLNDSNSSNYVLSTSNILVAKADLNDINSSNYVLSTSNILVAKADLNDSNSSNYVLSTSNILIAKADLNDRNSSNYVLSTSNILVAKADLNDRNSSNYVLSTSNILVAKADLNDRNSSNYVLSTSNILVAKADLNDRNSSNYVLSISNILSTQADLINTNNSDYVLSTSNILVAKADLNDKNSSNYVLSTSNILVAKIDLNDKNSSNYVLSTSNILVAKADLNDKNSSNYVLSTSNILVAKADLNDKNSSNYILSTSNILVAKIDLNDRNSSNYVLSTSNILVAKADLNDKNSSNYVLSTSNILVAKADLNDKNSSNYVLSTSNILVAKADLNDKNSSNYVLSTSNILVAKADLNDKNSSNYVLSTSNILVAKADLNDKNSSNYVLSTSNILVAKADLNDKNSSNYVLSTSNILVGRIKDTSNYIVSTSNLIMEYINNKNFSQWTTSNNIIYYNSNVAIGTINSNSNILLNVGGITNSTEYYVNNVPFVKERVSETTREPIYTVNIEPSITPSLIYGYTQTQQIEQIIDNSIPVPLTYTTINFSYSNNFPLIGADSTDSLLAFYRFNSNILDTNPNTTAKYNLVASGTPYATPSFSTDLFQGRIYIKGGSQMSILNSDGIPHLNDLLTSDFSIAFWVKARNSTTPRYILNQTVDPNLAVQGLYIGSTGEQELQYVFGIRNGNSLGVGTIGYPDINNWVHLVYVIKNNANWANNWYRSIYRNGVLIASESQRTDVPPQFTPSIPNIRLFISANTDYSDLRIYKTALEATEISRLYNSYNSNIYSINFNTANVIINGGINIPYVSGNYLISTGYNNSSIIPTQSQTALDYTPTTTTLTIKYPTQTYILSQPFNYKKDGFLKYVAGNRTSSITRNTGVWEIINYDTIGVDNSNYTLSTSNILIGHVSGTSNILIGYIKDTSNYVLLTSNILVAKADLNDKNSSNYVLSTSNILVAKADLNDKNSSNYVLLTSNILVAKIDLNDKNSSNYVLSTSNILIGRISDTSNFVSATSNILIGRISDTSNYIALTSNLIMEYINNKSFSQWTTSNNIIYYNSNVAIGKINSNSNILLNVGGITNSTEYYVNNVPFVKERVSDTDGKEAIYSSYIEPSISPLVGYGYTQSQQPEQIEYSIMIPYTTLNFSYSNNFPLISADTESLRALYRFNSNILDTNPNTTTKYNLVASSETPYASPSFSTDLFQGRNYIKGGSEMTILNSASGSPHLNDLLTSDFSVAFWFKSRTSATNQQYILAQRNYDTGLTPAQGLNIGWTINDDFRIQYTFKVNSDSLSGTSEHLWSDKNNWVHLVYVIKQVNSKWYRSIYRNGVIVISDPDPGILYTPSTPLTPPNPDIRLFITPNTDHSDLRIYRTALSSTEIDSLYKSYNSNIYSISFNQRTSNIFINGDINTPYVSGNYLISTGYNKSSIISTENQDIPLANNTSTQTITIKYPTNPYRIAPYNYKKDGFLKYVAGNRASSNTRDTGVWEIINYDTIGIDNSNYTLSTSNILIGHVSGTSNILIGYIKDTSNYVLSTSNILVAKADINDKNSSNYVLSTSNILVKRIIDEINFGSNYVLSTSNILVKRIIDEVNFGSNYVLSTSNILVKRIIDEVNFGSNYVLSTSNILVKRIIDEVNFGSNYVLSTSNILVKRIIDEVNFGSNYVLSTSNILVAKADINDKNSSNFVSATSNILIGRIKDTSNYIALTSNLIMEYINNKSFSQWTTSNNIIYYNSNVAIGKINSNSNILLNVGGITNSTEYYVNNVPFVKERVSDTDGKEAIYSSYIEPSISPLVGYTQTQQTEQIEYSIMIPYTTLNFSYSNNFPLISADTESLRALYRFNSNILDTNPNTTTKYNLVASSETPYASPSFSTDLFQGRNYIKGGSQMTILNSDSGSPHLNDLLTSEFSVAFWFKSRTSATNQQYILAQRNYDTGLTPSQGLNIGWTINNDFRIQYTFNVNAETLSGTSEHLWPDKNNWVHLVYVIKQVNSKWYRSIYRNGVIVISDPESGILYTPSTPPNPNIRLFITPNTDHSDLRIYRTALSSTEIDSLYKSYNSNIYSISFNQRTSNIFINGDINTPYVSGNYLISTGYNKSSIISTENQDIPLANNTSTQTITIKYPTNPYRIAPYNYKKDGFLKYVAGNRASSNTRDTGVWEIINYDTIGIDNSNYTLSTSNILIARADINEKNSSNYVLSTSNIISNRISNLTTDMIIQNTGSQNKFIVNNVYNNDITVNGTITIRDNLIVRGNETQLDTIVYTTERLQVINENNNSVALIVQQKSSDSYIFVASNITTNVLTLSYNGDVNIIGKYKINNSDVIKDTSNYVSSTSNILIDRIKDTSNYISSTSNILVGRIKDTSNYIVSTSNLIMEYINNKNFSQWTTSNNIIYYNSNVAIGTINSNSNILLNVGGITNSIEYYVNNVPFVKERVSETTREPIYTVNIEPSITPPSLIYGYTQTQQIEQIIDNSIPVPLTYTTLNFSYSNNFPLISADSTDSLRALYRFNNNILDTNPNTTTKYNLVASGTPYATPSFSTDLFQGRIYIKGGSQMSILNSASGSPHLNDLLTSDFSIAFWFRPRLSTPSERYILSQPADTNLAVQGVQGLNIGCVVSTKIQYYFRVNTDTLSGTGDNTFFDIDNWVHLVYVIKQVNSKWYRSIYRNGVSVISDPTPSDLTGIPSLPQPPSIPNIRLFISVNTDYSDLRIYKTALEATEISKLYNSYNSNIYSINFNTANVIINGGINIPYVSGNYLISTGYNNSSIIPTQSQTALAYTPTTTLTIKYPTQTYILSQPFNYKKDGFLKYVAGNRTSSITRNTGVWEIINYDTIGIDNSNYTLSTSNILIGHVSGTSNILIGYIKDTSNYVLSTSNILIAKADLNDKNSSNYVLSTSNILVTKVDLNDKNSSNYVLSTSNILVAKVDLNDRNSSNYVLSTSNILVAKVDLNDRNSSNYILSTSNILIAKIDLNDKNSSNYVLSTSNILIAKADLNDKNSSNYVLSTSNILIAKADLNDKNSSNYVLSTSNILVAKADLNDRNSSNYVILTSNILIAKADLNDKNSSNYVLSTSNILVAKADINDRNSSNYVLSNSNILVAKADLNDKNSSNYVLSTSNILVTKIDLNDSNSSNYVLSTSNILIGHIKDTSNYIVSTSNLIIEYINNKNFSQWTTSNNIIYYNSNVAIGTINSNSNIQLNVSGITNSTEYYINNIPFISERLSVPGTSNYTKIYEEPTVFSSRFTSNISNPSNGTFKTLKFDYYNTEITQEQTILPTNIIARYKFDGNGDDDNPNSTKYHLTKFVSGTEPCNISYSSGSNYWQGRRYLNADQGVTSNANLLLGKTFSVSVWLRSKTIVTSGHYILYNDFDSNNSLLIGYTNNNNKISFFNSIIQNTNEYKNTPNAIYLNNTWVHVVSVFEVSSTLFSMPIYINGNLLSSIQSPQSISENAITAYNKGIKISCGDDNSKADLRDLRIYNIALTPTQISSLYTSYTCNNHSVDFRENNTAVVNNNSSIDVLGKYNISIENNNWASLFPDSNQSIYPLINPLGLNSNITIKFPMSRNDIFYQYKKDGFLKYVAGDQNSIATRNTGKWEITDYDTIGSALQATIYDLSTSNTCNINILRANILDTSNYVLSTSNILIANANLNDKNSSNYVLTTSNLIMDYINKKNFSQWTTSNNMIYYNTSNIGIGIYNPINKLHLYDDSNNATKLMIQNNNTNIIAGVLPTEIIVSEATTLPIIGGIYRMIAFPYSGTEITKDYSFTPTENLVCDILVVGGGGGGGKMGGGGGAGAILFGTNIKLYANSPVSIKIGKGGAGATEDNSGINGKNGEISSITISSTEYIAMGGGGGGTIGTPASLGAGTAGTAGGSGGGGSAGESGSAPGGESNKKNYANFQSFGNNGGRGKIGTSGNPAYSSGGGGGAGSAGSDFHLITGDPNTSTTGNGGLGKNFTSYFGNSVGDTGWFGGGGGGNTYRGQATGSTRGFGNGGNELFGGGGHGAFEPVSELKAGDGKPNTGGGGGGGKLDGADDDGGKGGTGYVIIRYTKEFSTSSSLELVRGSTIDGSVNYSIGNYDNYFKIISYVSGTPADILTISLSGNITFSGSINASSYLLNGSRFSVQDTSNYVLSTSNILIAKANLNDKNSSNYVLSTSNILIAKTNLNDSNSSNYVLSTSNILIARIKDTSNYIATTSNLIMDFINKKNFSQWNTSNNNIYYNIGNIGIGNGVPVSALTINNSITSNNFDHSFAPLTITNNTVITTINESSDVLHLCRVGGVSANLNTGTRASFSLTKWATVSGKSKTKLNIKLADEEYNTSAPILVIRSDGRVGIGDLSDPREALEVVGNIRAASFIGNVNVNTVTGTLSVANGGTGLTTFTNGGLLFVSSATTLGQTDKLFWNNTDYKLGVGTNVLNTKSSILSINSIITNDSFDHSVAPLTITNQTGPSSLDTIDVLHLCRVGGSSTYDTGTRATFRLGKWVANNTSSKTRLDIALSDGAYNTSNIVMTIQSDGKVGIGKTNPLVEFDVVGDINISSNKKYKINNTDLALTDLTGTLEVNKGGTGSTNFTTTNGLIIGSGTNTFTQDTGLTYASSILNAGNVNVPSGGKYKINNTDLALTDLTGTLAVNKGGTGAINFTTTNGLIIGSGTNAFIQDTGLTYASSTLNAGNVNVSSGGKYKINGINLALTDLTGTLAVDKGGTGSTNFTTTNGLIIGNGTNTFTQDTGLTYASSTLNAGNVNVSSGGKYKINGINLSYNDLTNKLTAGSGININATTNEITATATGTSSQWINNQVNTTKIYYNDGNVGIGTTNPVGALHVEYGTGNIIAKGDITAYYSDERLKTKISTINNPLSIVTKLNGFYYIPNEIATKYGINNNKVEIGLSAQDVQKVLPELVKLAPFDMKMNEAGEIISKSGEKYLTISYERLVPVLVEAIKELNQKNISSTNENNTTIKIDEHRAIIKSLEERIKDLETKITRILNYINI